MGGAGVRGWARWIGAALAVAALAAGAEGPAGDLDQYTSAAVSQWKEPGLAIAVVKDGRMVFARGYGVRRLGRAAAVDEDTVFAIGSLTKAFTAASAAMLVDEGKLDWDGRVIDFLPGFRMYDPWVTREMRLRDLMCHRSGLPAYGGDLMVFGSTYGREELLRRVRYLKPASSFRSKFAYSNLMFLAAGEVVEAAAGVRWDDFVAQRIFAPLGMSRSNTSVTKLAGEGDVAYPNGYIGGESREVERRNADNIGPAGSINSTARDMARWMMLQLGRGQYDGRRLFSEKTSREMWEVQTPRPVEGADAPLFNGYGLGWGVSEYRGRKMLSHAGGLAGMTSFIALLPEEKLGVVVLTNGELPVAPAVARRAMDAYLGAPPRDWSGEALKRFQAREKAEAREWSEVLRKHAAAGAGPAEDAARYAGTYRSEALGDVEVKAAGAGLEVRLAPLPRAVGKAERWAEETYLIRWANAAWPETFLTFEREAGGGVAGARMRLAREADESLDFPDYEFKKVER